MRYLALAIAILLGGAPAAAVGQTTMMTSDLCLHLDNTSPENLACTYYIQGFVQGLIAGQTGAEMSMKVCIPDGETYGQDRLIVDKYIRDHPEDLHFGDGAVVWAALVTAFPCKKAPDFGSRSVPAEK